MKSRKDTTAAGSVRTVLKRRMAIVDCWCEERTGDITFHLLALDGNTREEQVTFSLTDERHLFAIEKAIQHAAEIHYKEHGKDKPEPAN
jgi:hypothetical protein